MTSYITMPEPVQGFITKAGRFFPTVEAAELNEAEVELEEAINKLGIVEADDVLTVINSLTNEVLRYAKAKIAQDDIVNGGRLPTHEGNSDKPAGSGDT